MGFGSDLPFDTELHEAVRFSDICQVQEALDNKNDPNQIGLYQWAPVHEAASNGEVEILKLLLKHNGAICRSCWCYPNLLQLCPLSCNSNVQDELKGRTPLHYAAEEGHLDCVELLTKAGGDCQIEDSDGLSAVQLATGECRSFLQTFSEENLAVRSSASNPVNHSPRTHPVNDDTSHSNSISFLSTLQSDNEQSPTLGHAELSFEYNSRRKTLRIRVWQVTDIILPPDNVSMVGSIYVKSFLIPDSSRASKRKTEELKVTKAILLPHQEDDTKTLSVTESVKLQFCKPLEYTGISKEDVEEKTVQIELCVTQKYSRKSYLVSMYRLPCKTAVRRLVRQKYPLIACNNPTIPDSLRFRAATSLNVPVNSSIYHSNPNLRSSSKASLNSGTFGYAASDTAIEDISIQVHRTPRLESQSNVIITVSTPEDDHTADVLSEVKAIPVKQAKGQRLKHASIDFISDSDCLQEVHCVKNVKNSVTSVSHSNKIDMTKSVTIPIVKRITKFGFYPVSLMEARERTVSSLEAKQSPAHLTKVIQIDSEEATPHVWSGSNNSSPSHSRPDTPSWDHSDILSATDDIDMEDRAKTEWSEDANLKSVPCLPLPSSLAIPCRGTSFSAKSSNTPVKYDETHLSNPIKKGKRPMKKSGYQAESHIHYKSSSNPLNADVLSRDITLTGLPRDITLNSKPSLSVQTIENGCDKSDTICIDIDSEEYNLPEAVQQFTIPSQVYLTDDSD